MKYIHPLVLVNLDFRMKSNKKLWPQVYMGKTEDIIQSLTLFGDKLDGVDEKVAEEEERKGRKT